MTDRLTAGLAHVAVPGTSANLGPGYDALGVALSLHDRVTAEVVEGPPGSVQVEVEGEGSTTVPRDATHLVFRALLAGFAALDVPAPAIRLRCRNALPHGRGLGSSSAAIVAGLHLARALCADGGALDDRSLFRLAARIEGHPDNVAPAVMGGLTIAWRTGSDGFEAHRLDVDPDLAFVVFVPPDPLETSVARRLLPSSVPHGDAAHSVGRAALLLPALTGRPDLLLAATEDRLHQDYRAPAMPRSSDLIAALRADGVAATVSGAGPTVLAIVPSRQAGEVSGRAPQGWAVHVLDADPTGARADAVPG